MREPVRYYNWLKREFKKTRTYIDNINPEMNFHRGTKLANTHWAVINCISIRNNIFIFLRTRII